MHRFKNILLVQIPGGGSGHALNTAIELARRNGGKLKIMSAVGESPTLTRLELTAIPDVDLEQLVAREHQERLQLPAQAAREAGVEVETVVRFGRPFVAVTKEVMEHEHDLVIKTAEGSHGFSDQLFGTTGLNLIRKCPCPVWILKAEADPSTAPQRILAAVDPCPDDDDLPVDDAHFHMNDRILELAASLARAHGSELDIVHAWSVPGEALLRGKARLSAEKVDAMVAETREWHRRELQGLLAEHDWNGLDVNVRLLQGEPEDVISAFARHKNADLIVMGSLGRTGLEGLLVGNTAEKVLGKAQCSVLTIKPADFVSPIQITPDSDEVGPPRRVAAQENAA